MTLSEDIKDLEKRLDQVHTVEKLREVLFEKGLKLVVVLISNEFSCLEWNITQKQVSKILDLGLRIRISRISEESESLETVQYESIRMKESSWMDLDSLFGTLKKGIKESLKRVEMTRNE